MRDALFTLVEEMIAQQDRRLRELAGRTIAGLAAEDFLAPDDVPRLREDPDTMYETGVLAGLLSARAAIRALLADRGEPEPGRGPAPPDGRNPG